MKKKSGLYDIIDQNTNMTGYFQYPKCARTTGNPVVRVQSRDIGNSPRATLKPQSPVDR